MDVWDIRLNADKPVSLPQIAGRTAALVVLHGTVQVNGTQVVRESQMALLDRAGDELLLEANNQAVVLLLSGEPIDEPIVGYGPFVMNSQTEIEQAIHDFQSGEFGQISSHS